MIRFRQHRRAMNSPREGARGGRVVIAYIVALVFIAPGFGLAADWLAPASDQAVTAPWVKDIAAQLKEQPYRD
ncbi:MAG: hypothetical protein MRJ68_21155, partial [Nitrospira sp.]|nr:hypothetical protein [Nitrospira sp.]